MAYSGFIGQFENREIELERQIINVKQIQEQNEEMISKLRIMFACVLEIDVSSAAKFYEENCNKITKIHFDECISDEFSKQYVRRNLCMIKNFCESFGNKLPITIVKKCIRDALSYYHFDLVTFLITECKSISGDETIDNCMKIAANDKKYDLVRLLLDNCELSDN